MGNNPKYEGLYDLPYPEGVPYPYERMPAADRAAQFAPFKALSGYEDAVEEERRLTETRMEPDDGELNLLNAKMQVLQDLIGAEPEITVTWFVPDEKKAGGRYRTVTGRVKRIDRYERVLQFTDGVTVPLDGILAMEGEAFAVLSWNE